MLDNKFLIAGGALLTWEPFIASVRTSEAPAAAMALINRTLTSLWFKRFQRKIVLNDESDFSGQTYRVHTKKWRISKRKVQEKFLVCAASDSKCICGVMQKGPPVLEFDNIVNYFYNWKGETIRKQIRCNVRKENLQTHIGRRNRCVVQRTSSLSEESIDT